MDLAQQARRLETRPVDPRRRIPAPGPRLMTAVAVALLLVAGLGWSWLQSSPDSPARAVTRLATALRHGDWAQARQDLCRWDQQRYGVSDIAQFGSGARLVLKGSDHVAISGVSGDSFLDAPTARVRARVVSGLLTPAAGQPSTFSVTVVLESSGWRPCLSVGGYSAQALGVDVPLASGVQAGPGGNEASLP